MYDVLIVGGGPAGSAAATTLARQGHRILILEREEFPRHHIGESTLLSIHSSLRWLGVEEKVEAAGFRRKTGATYIWGMDRVPWSFHFTEMEDASGWRRPYSYEIERDVFDKMLLDHAVENGAGLRRADVEDFVLENDRVVGARLGSGEIVTARIVIDASGQKCLAGRRFGWREMNGRLRNAAIYGYWKGGPPRYERLGGDLNPEDRSNILICSTPWGWIWLIPQRGDRVSVGAVLAGGSDRPPVTTLEQTYIELIHGCEEIAPLFDDLKLNHDEPVRSISDWSYCCRRFTLPGLFLAGDAACFVDPILSSGLHLALRAGTSAACASGSILAGEEEELVRSWYESTYRAAYRDYEAMALWWYHGDRNRESWFQVAQTLIDPALYGSDLVARKAFVQIASGLPPLPYVAVEAPGPAGCVQMISLFHLGAAFTQSLPRLRSRFGVTESPDAEPPAAHQARSLELRPALRGPRFAPGVKLTMEADPQRVRVGFFAYPSEARSHEERQELTFLAQWLQIFDGASTLEEICGAIGLVGEERFWFHRLLASFQTLGVMTGVPEPAAMEARAAVV